MTAKLVVIRCIFLRRVRTPLDSRVPHTEFTRNYTRASSLHGTILMWRWRELLNANQMLLYRYNCDFVVRHLPTVFELKLQPIDTINDKYATTKLSSDNPTCSPGGPSDGDACLS